MLNEFISWKNTDGRGPIRKLTTQVKHFVLRLLRMQRDYHFLTPRYLLYIYAYVISFQMYIFCLKWLMANSFWFTEGFDWREWVKLEKLYKSNGWDISFQLPGQGFPLFVCTIIYLEQQKVFSMNEPPVQCYRKQKKDNFQH